MKNLIIKNTFKILRFNILFQILMTSAYFFFSYLVMIPFSEFPIPQIIRTIYNIMIPVGMTAVKIFLLNIYSRHIKHNNKSQLVIPLIINLFIFLLCELLVFMNGKYNALFYLFMGINPIASFYSESICIDLAFKEEFRIPFMFSMIVIENIVYLIVLYFSAKKKKDSEIKASDDTVIAENSDDSE